MKHQYKYFFILFSFLIIWLNSGFSQDIEFKKLVPPDEKTFEFVTGIAQDENGVMWFASKRGLFSYDGTHLTSNKNNPANPNSLSSNFLESIFVDTHGIIWIGNLGKGLDRFDTESGIFTHFHHDSNVLASLSNDTVTAILRDKQGTLWIGTHQGLDQFDPKTNKFNHFRHNANDPTTISNNQVRVIYEDKAGTLWIGTGSPYLDNGGGPQDGGLNRLDKKTGKFTRYLHDPINTQSLISNKISAISEDQEGNFWIGTGLNGLHKMNRQDGTFERFVFDPAHPEKLNAPAITPSNSGYEHITFFSQDEAGSYWFGTVDAGIYYFNPAVGKIKHYQGTEKSPSGFTDNGAWKAFTSRDGIFWIGGTQGTIYRFNPLQKKFENTLVSGAPVGSFFEEPNGIFWIGARNDLIRTDSKTGISKSYGKEITPLKTTENDVHEIIKDREGNLWVGNSNGLARWDKDKEKFVVYLHNTKDETSISDNTVLQILEDSQNNFWITTFYGLNLMDRKTGEFTHFLIDPADKNNAFGKNVITGIIEDTSGKLWIGTWNGSGVNLFDREKKTFKQYLKGSNIMCVFEDSDSVLWAGGSDGFYKYNPDIDNFIRFGDSGSIYGIPNVFNLVEDNQKYLWIGTVDGIVRLNPQRNETSFFGDNFGILKNSLSWLTVFKGLNGAIYFGNQTGYYKIDPTELLKNLNPPELIINSFRIADQTIKPGTNGPLKEPLSKVKDIKLRYNQNSFSFNFAVMDYANPEENRIICYLENFDKSWVQPNSDGKAYYFNIPPGKYIFRVKASNSDGVWIERKIDIIILHPWYRTWLAYGIYGLVFIALIFAFDRFQRRRIVMAERRRNQEKELVQAKEIEKAYTELKSTQAQLIQSEKMASLGELTAGIAHEIQNPLNFVNNFSEISSELLDEMKVELVNGNTDEAAAIANDVQQNLEKIIHHGKRADSIVKGMLQHSRSSKGIKEPTDINALADEYLRLAYHGLRAKDKSFNATLITDFDETIGKINVVPQEIGRVILNLLTNAFYAVTAPPPPEGGIKNPQIQHVPTVTVSTSYLPPSGGMRGAGNGGAVLISVKDNGPGIPQNILDKIFQPFFTTKPTGKGTGLGLSMSYDIVTKGHGGELKVENEEGRGAKFTIILPV